MTEPIKPPAFWTARVADLKDPTTATADVTQTSWCTWDVRLLHAGLQWGPDGAPYVVLGTRARALRVAARKLQRYRRRIIRDQQREQQRVTLT